MAKPPAAHYAMSTRTFVLWLLAALSIGAVVRLPTLGAGDFWLDELHSLLNSAGNRSAFESLPYDEILHDIPRFTALDPESSLAGVWRGMRDDSHPPAYFELLHIWRRLCGDGEFAVRLPSAMFSVVALLLPALILREVGRPGPGIAATLLLCVAFADLHVGQQARPYSLAILLAGIGYWLTVRVEQRRARLDRRQKAAYAVAYAATVLAAVLTHYFAALALAGQAAYALLRFRGRLLALWVASGLAAAAGFAILWLPSMISQWAFIQSQDWLADAAAGHGWRTAVRAADLPIRLLLWTGLPDWDRWQLVGLGAAGVSLLIAAACVHWSARSRESLIFWFWFGVPCVTLAALDLATGKQLLTHLRYSAVATPGLCGLLVLAAATRGRPTRQALAAAAAVMVALTLRLPATNRPDARAAAALLAERMRTDDLLVFDATHWPSFWARRDFVQVWQYLPRVNYGIVMLNEPPSPDTLARICSYDRVFVMSPRIDALPNPSPSTHGLSARSAYLDEIGWVYLFEKTVPVDRATPPTGSTAPGH